VVPGLADGTRAPGSWDGTGIRLVWAVATPWVTIPKETKAARVNSLDQLRRFIKFPFLSCTLVYSSGHKFPKGTVSYIRLKTKCQYLCFLPCGD
jgi:hypothetical protein